MVTKAKSEDTIKPLKNVQSFSSWKLPSINAGKGTHFFQPEEDEPEQEPEISAEQQQAIQAAELEKLKQQAKEQGFNQGKAEGLAAAQEKINQQTRLMEQIIQQLNDPLSACGEITEQAILKLSFAIAKQIVRRELKQDPTQLIAIIREALKKLPIDSGNITIWLHPEDEAIITAALSKGSDAEQTDWQIKSNPTIERASCRVDTENSTVDASIDKQIAVLFSELVGDLRAHESSRTSLESSNELDPQTAHPSNITADTQTQQTDIEGNS